MSVETLKPSEKFLRAADAVAYLSEAHGLQISKSGFLSAVRGGKYPQPPRLSPRRPVWRQTALDAFAIAL